jgi:hypothetical protein
VRARLALATTCLLAATILAACGEDNGGDGGNGGGAGPTTTAGPGPTTSTTLPAGIYHRFSAPARLSDGFVVATSPDGSALYVEAVDPELSQRGCEGLPEPVLFRVPLDGGPREAIRAGGVPVRGNLVRGPGGRAALITGCEEFLTAVRVGTETPDGHLRDLREVPLGEGRVGLGTFAWTSDGQRLLAARRDFTAGGVASVVSVDPGTGAVAPVFEVAGAQAVNGLAQLAPGTFVVAAAGQVTLRDGSGAVRNTVEGLGFTTSPALGVVVFGTGLQLLETGAPAPAVLVPASAGPTLSAAVSPDGRAVAYTAGGDGSDSVAVVTPSDHRTSTIASGGGRFVRPAFTGDGEAVAFTRFEVGTGREDVLVVRFG